MNTNNDKYVDQNELNQFASKYGMANPANAIKEFDADGDGRLDYNEFMKASNKYLQQSI